MKGMRRAYIEKAERAISLIRKRITNYSVRVGSEKAEYIAWGQHIDDKDSKQIGIYGTSGAIEIIDTIDAEENPLSPIPEDVSKALSFLLNKSNSLDDIDKYQLMIIPKLSSILACLSLRLINKDSKAKELRKMVVDRIKKSQNRDGGWAAYYPRFFGETYLEIPASEPLITSIVLSAIVKTEAKDEIDFDQAIHFLTESLKGMNLPLHSQLFSLFSIRCAKPEISNDFIKTQSKLIIRGYEKIYPNILEVYCPFEVKYPIDDTIRSEYFVVKQKTLFLHYLARFEFHKFCDCKWFQRAIESIDDIIRNEGGERSGISLRIGTRNTLSATAFLLQSKRKITSDKFKCSIIYYATKFVRSIITRFTIIGLLVYASFLISPAISESSNRSFFFGVIAALVADSILKTCNLWNKR